MEQWYVSLLSHLWTILQLCLEYLFSQATIYAETASYQPALLEHISYYVYFVLYVVAVYNTLQLYHNFML